MGSATRVHRSISRDFDLDGSFGGSGFWAKSSADTRSSVAAPGDGRAPSDWQSGMVSRPATRGGPVSVRLKPYNVIPELECLRTVLTAGTSKAGWKPALRPFGNRRRLAAKSIRLNYLRVSTMMPTTHVESAKLH